jgi:hypothetical protein
MPPRLKDSGTALLKEVTPFYSLGSLLGFA